MKKIGTWMMILTVALLSRGIVYAADYGTDTPYETYAISLDQAQQLLGTTSSVTGATSVSTTAATASASAGTSNVGPGLPSTIYNLTKAILDMIKKAVESIYQ